MKTYVRREGLTVANELPGLFGSLDTGLAVVPAAGDQWSGSPDFVGEELLLQMRSDEFSDERVREVGSVPRGPRDLC